LSAGAEGLKAATGADIIVGIPEDEHIFNISEQDGNLRHLSPDNPVLTGLDRIIEIVK
jgi:hypothetical protein